MISRPETVLAASVAPPERADAVATASTGGLSHPLAWYRALTPVGRAAFFSCFAGVTLDAMDLRIYSFLMPSLAASWGVSDARLGALFSATMVTGALGGWTTGLLSDRFGRVRVLQLTILIYSIFTFLSGFASNFTELMIFRCIQGFGYGGEITAGIVLMAEMVPNRYRGTAVGSLQSGFAVGWALAAVVSGVLLTMLPLEWGWRATFWAGLAPAALVLVLRRFVKEPVHHRQAEGSMLRRIFAIFDRRLVLTTILTSLIAGGAQGSAIATSTWLPTYLSNSVHLSSAVIGVYIGIVTFGSLLGYMTGAYFTDVIGRRPMFLVYSLGSLTVLTVYLFVPMGTALMLPLGLLVGFFSQGIYSILGPFIAELFPTPVRANGTSFAYGIGRLGAAASVSAVGAMANADGLRTGLLVVLAINYLFVLLPLLLLRETKGIDLEL
ncbi:MAG TPA: MFS transporter [Sphingomonas sp.]